MATEKNKKYVKFTVSPTGAFGLAYNAEEFGELDADQADVVVLAGYAQYCDKDGNLIDGGNAAAKDDAADVKALVAKAEGFGIEVPKDATAGDVQKLIDDSHKNALEEVKKLREASVKTNDPVKEAAATAAKAEPKAENAADKGAAGAEKS